MGRLGPSLIIIVGVVLLLAAGLNDARVSGGGILAIFYGLSKYGEAE